MRRPILFIGGPADGEVFEHDPEATSGLATIYYREGESGMSFQEGRPLDTSPTPRMIYKAFSIEGHTVFAPETMTASEVAEKLIERYGKK